MGDVVVPQQDAIEVFPNDTGNVVIYQRDDSVSEEAYVLVRPENAAKLSAAIMACAEELGAATGAPKDATAAERQRRYRERRRDGG